MCRTYLKLSILKAWESNWDAGLISCYIFLKRSGNHQVCSLYARIELHTFIDEYFYNIYTTYTAGNRWWRWFSFVYCCSCITIDKVYLVFTVALCVYFFHSLTSFGYTLTCCLTNFRIRKSFTIVKISVLPFSVVGNGM